ncbi:MAG: helix-turn-helix domain-containing protein [Anaerolineae bacterium]|nr:helix-turn-helix domain-containing protein [Anaerolineae bacterium]
MFGNKQDKDDRLHQLVSIVRACRPASITQAELARRLGVQRSTVLKDLDVLQAKGLYIVDPKN